jgi:acetoin utilization deacetylase AcuC-like enzyme
LVIEPMIFNTLSKHANRWYIYFSGYDCPLHQGLYDYATMTAGATLVAAECLLQETCRVAINWCGGWHHSPFEFESAKFYCIYIWNIVESGINTVI